ncbi:RNA polymerase I-specific transcription initiation factor RRN3 [Tetrabaena socialis]|uniref:RNA polymerase I-specific transcription initiation factor RRN3 n=1 Tax=Tetrabaena socialis TaxID=47790 RepID=A0A2J7ZT05_9CHLO|nr:RNA polymerase I-specific transcription initiation factor RRN3 [Tetrabaena socialis]|eukprot:PNH03401.1 RNA polymerase I-specific transcription initiation factor RRN3 [Tetrabaena socialis]
MARPASNPELNTFVASALLKRGKEYDELKFLLRECRNRAEQEPGNEEAVLQLCTLVGAVTANVSAIRERKHEAIVADILGIKLWTAAPGILSAVLDFTRNLVVANSAFTHTCLQLIVYSFTPPPGPPDPTDPSQDPHGAWRPSEQALTVHQALLSLLNRVMALVPTAPTNVLPLIVTQMPHKLRDRNTQCLYLSALFRIAEDRSGASMREALLTAVVEHLLSLDVEIRWEDIADVPTGEEEEADDGVVEDIFELEGMLASELDINAGPEEVAQRHAVLAMRNGAAGDGRGGWEGAVAGAHNSAGGAGAGQQPQASSRPPVDEMANKLDSMMELAFEHLAKRIAAGDQRQVWETLLSAFERTVLNTHRSKFTQFLLFYSCLSSPGHSPHGLLRLLFTRLRDTRQPAITRAACAAYLASFLARSAFLSEAVVVKALQELSCFCLEYCNNQQAGGCGPNRSSNGGAPPPAGSLADCAPFASMSAEAASSQTQRHQVLYAAVQAVLYVLCYHMHPLVGSLHQQQQGGSADQADGAKPASGSATAPTTAAGAAAPATSSSERRQLAEAVVAMVRGPVWQVLNHRLQPLGVCLPSVAAEFVHQAAALGIVDCRSLLSQLEPSSRSQRPLEMFFPFDPYLLKRSSRYLQLKHSYVRWRHGHPLAAVAGAEAQEAGESEDDEDEGHGEDGAGVRGGSDDGQDDDLSTSSTSSSGQDDADGDSEDGEPGRSMPSDAVLHDPRYGASRRRPHHPAVRGLPAAGTGVRRSSARGRGSLVAGASYMSYASTETASQGAMSPCGMSPYDGGDMLVHNPLGTSPGAVPMSLGTPEAHFMAQVPLRISRR